MPKKLAYFEVKNLTPDARKITLQDKKKDKKLFKSEKIKKHYFRTFYYSFAISFIILGSIAVLFFIYNQDKNIFGFSERYYEEASKYIAENDYASAEKSLVDCLNIDPEYTKARLSLIDIYDKEGKLDDALKLLQESISMQPRNEEYYIKNIAILTKQNKIAEAMDFIKSISTNYIIVKISQKRPNSIVSSPDQGTYGNAIDIHFNIPKDSKIYYTLDNSSPTKLSKLYEDNNPIRIEKGNNTLRAFAINNEGIVTDEYKATYRIYNDNTQYLFEDEKMESIVRISINKPEGSIYYRDLEKVITLTNEIRGGTLLSGNIKKLDDLQAMSNLSAVILKNEPDIESLDPLLTIKTLRELELSACTINNEDLKKLSSIIWLDSLRLEGNAITDISPIASMIILKELSVSNNTLKNISDLTKLPNLKKLNISKNLISDISSLSQMTKLQVLDISENLISDLSSISSLTLLTELNIGGNKVKLLDGISRIPRIETLVISNNPISSLYPLSSYTGLINLKADGCKNISSLDALEDMSSLTTLDVSNTSITDYLPLAGMKVKNLTASDNALTDLTSLTNVNSLEILELSNNTIIDVIPLVGLSKLKVLNLSGNYVYNLPVLVDCVSLEMVNTSNSTTISDADVALLESKKITVIK